jgi:hypothetical protein
MPRGDHVSAHRGGYQHHGIDLGDETIVHFAPGRHGGPLTVQRTWMRDFAGADPVHLVPYATAFPPDYVCLLALSQLGRKDYSLFSDNCEHMAVFCKTGRKASAQVSEVTAELARMGLGLFHPPLGARSAFKLLARGVKTGARQVWKAVTAEEQPRTARSMRTLLFRYGNFYTGEDGRAWLQYLSGQWAASESDSGLRPSPTPEVAPSLFGRIWTDTARNNFIETHQGWLALDARGQLAFHWPSPHRADPHDTSHPRFLTAPLEALHTNIEYPDGIQDWQDAVAEVFRRGCGDLHTYTLLGQVARADALPFRLAAPGSYDYVRVRSLWTLGYLNRMQNSAVATPSLPGLSALVQTALSEDAPPSLRLAALQGMQLLDRPSDPLLRAAWARAAQVSDADVRGYAGRLLAGERLAAEYLARMAEWYPRGT